MLEILTPAVTNHLTTLARVKTELSITDTAQDARLLDYISEASDMIAAWCNRDTFGLEEVRQTERLSRARECIILARDLAVNITSVTVDGVALTTDDYERDGPLLYRIEQERRTCWFASKVVMEYQTGFSLLGGLPPAIERACLDLVVNLVRGAGRDSSVRQESVEGIGSTSFFKGVGDALPISADRISQLTRYRALGGV